MHIVYIQPYQFLQIYIKPMQRYAIIIEEFLRSDVLDSFIMAFRDEDSIIDQIYEKQIFSAFYYVDSKFSK